MAKVFEFYRESDESLMNAAVDGVDFEAASEPSTWERIYQLIMNERIGSSRSQRSAVMDALFGSTAKKPRNITTKTPDNLVQLFPENEEGETSQPQ